MVSGKIETHLADAVVLASGGYGNVFFLSTNAMGCNATAVWRAHRKGAYFANPCYTQIHPTCIPQSGDFQSKLTLMSESLRNDGRIWVPKKAEDCDKDPRDIPEEARDYDLDGALGLGDLRGVGVDLAQAQHVRQVVVHGVGQDEVAVGQPLHEGGGAQAVGAVVGEVGLSGDVEARDVGLQVVVHP